MKQYKFTSADFVDPLSELSDDCFMDPNDPFHPDNISTLGKSEVIYTKPGIEDLFPRTLPKDR